MHSEVAYVPGIVKQILKSVFQDHNVTKLCPPEILFVGLMIAPPAPLPMSIPTLLFMSHDSFKLNTELMKSCFIICDGPLGCLVNIFQFSDVPYKDIQKKKQKLQILSELSLRGRDRGFPPDTINVAPGYFQRKIAEK